jgi:hypothetical protein
MQTFDDGAVDVVDASILQAQGMTPALLTRFLLKCTGTAAAAPPFTPGTQKQTSNQETPFFTLYLHCWDSHVLHRSGYRANSPQTRPQDHKVRTW